MPFTDPEAKRQHDRAYYLANKERIKAQARARSAAIYAGTLQSASRTPLMEQLLRHVKLAGSHWLWSGSLSEHGYGRLNVKGRTTLAHRVAYELYIGRIPDGMTLDHLCRVHACVNPKHLEPVSLVDNLMRGIPGRMKGRCRKGHDSSHFALKRNGSTAYCRVCRNEELRRRLREDPVYREQKHAKDRARYRAKRQTDSDSARG
jgi:hypothetical protein